MVETGGPGNESYPQLHIEFKVSPSIEDPGINDQVNTWIELSPTTPCKRETEPLESQGTHPEAATASELRPPLQMPLELSPEPENKHRPQYWTEPPRDGCRQPPSYPSLPGRRRVLTFWVPGTPASPRAIYDGLCLEI